MGAKTTPRAAQEAPERRPRGPSALRASQTETERQTEKTKDKYNDLYMLSVLSLSGLGGKLASKIEPRSKKIGPERLQKNDENLKA